MRAYLFHSEPKILTQGDTEDARKRISDMNVVLRDLWNSANPIRRLLSLPWGTVILIKKSVLKEVKPRKPSIFERAVFLVGRIFTRVAVRTHRLGGRMIEGSGLEVKP